MGSLRKLPEKAIYGQAHQLAHGTVFLFGHPAQSAEDWVGKQNLDFSHGYMSCMEDVQAIRFIQAGSLELVELRGLA